MIGIQEMLVAVANTPKETPVVVDVGGNGKALMTVTSVEVKDGQLVIACSAKTDKTPAPVSAEPPSGGKETPPPAGDRIEFEDDKPATAPAS